MRSHQRGSRLLAAAPVRLPGARALLVLAVVAGATAACTRASAREPYLNTFATSEAAAQAVADALAARDAERLAALAVTEVEFRKNIWPHLPASRPEVGMPFEYLWAETSSKSRGYLASLLHELGGSRFTVTAVTFGGAPADYGTFRIHPRTRLDVTDDEGRTSVVRLFGSMVETDDAWKIFSFVVD